MSQKSFKSDSNALYLVPTPIGNLSDMTDRAIATLRQSDLIVCEDTRITGQLLAHYNIKKRLICSNEQTEDKVKEKVEQYLREGLNISIVTDRGTPIISDPGYRIVAYIIQKGYNVIGLPGPTAFVPALISSGIDPQPFLFYGFLNSKENKRRKEIQLLKDFKYTIIFYESPHRIISTLEILKDVFGNRKMAVCREISKIYEEIYRGNISEIISEIQSDNIKGEFVIVVEGNKEMNNFSDVSIEEHIKIYLDDGYSEKESIKLVAVDRGVRKSDIYKYYHTRK